jgi:hypothetical protein
VKLGTGKRCSVSEKRLEKKTLNCDLALKYCMEAVKLVINVSHFRIVWSVNIIVIKTSFKRLLNEKTCLKVGTSERFRFRA